MDTQDDHALLAALLDAAVDAIVVSDRYGKILRLNKAAAELFGHSIGDLTGQNVRVLMPPEIAAHHDGFLTNLMDTGEKRVIGIGRDVEGKKADGTIFPLHLSVGRADIGGDTTFVAILHDQTSRKSAEQAMARSQRMDAIGQMTGGIAHDFNNLLTVVIGNLELLEMTQTADQDKALIEDALEAAELGADLTSRLMVFARKSSLKPDVIILNGAVEQSLAMLRRTTGAQFEIAAALAEDLWPARADAKQVQTAVLNLALNAQDAMAAGGKIFLETRNVAIDDCYLAQEIGVQTGKYVRLSVSDTGAGMSAETRMRAIEPYFTTKAVGNCTGLGLSAVYGFVRQSGGHLTIYSEIGRGTTINLYFPALVGTDLQDSLSTSIVDRYTALGTDHLVLIVEDDLRVMRSSKARLLSFGFRCLTAATADAAWNILMEREDITLVFTDLVMPGTMTGHDLALRIASHKPHVRVLITSGFSESVLPDGRMGADFAILRKPFRQSELAEALQAVLADG